MDILFNLVLLIVGFLLLMKGADFFVEGSSAVAKRMKVPSIVVGLTLVAVGTSLPELSVSVVASINNANEMSLGNVTGSNIFNLLMVLGISALFQKVNVKESIFKREWPFLIIITALAVFLVGDALWFGKLLSQVNVFSFDNGNLGAGSVGTLDGILLLLLFVGFIIWTVRYALKERTNEEEPTNDVLSVGKSIIYMLCGIVAIVLGGDWVVDAAEVIALKLGMSETLVGLTVVAMGTSLPELVTSAVAARKGEADIAVGNVIGSNIANLLLVLGLSATISPVTASVMASIDLAISLVFTVIVLIMAKANKGIGKKSGIVLILFYAVYMAYIIARQYL